MAFLRRFPQMGGGDLSRLAETTMLHLGPPKGSRPIIFLGKLGILSQQGGGLAQSQLFIKIAQNLICLGTVHKCDETHST